MNFISKEKREQVSCSTNDFFYLFNKLPINYQYLIKYEKKNQISAKENCLYLRSNFINLDYQQYKSDIYRVISIQLTKYYYWGQ